MIDLRDRIVLVAGGAGTLGQTIVRGAAAAGATVVVPDRASDVAGLFPDLTGRDGHLFLDGVDATDEAATGALAERMRSTFGRLDALINVVGGYQAGSQPHETEASTWDFMMNLNARATFLINRAVIPLMLASGGRIVNTAARSAVQAEAGEIAYAASKSAVARITESIAAAYKEQGITANAVLPGNLDTPANREANPEADFNRWVSLDDLARLYLFLASAAGGVVNGALIPAYGRG